MREPPGAFAGGAPVPPTPAVEVLSAHKTYPNGTVALQPVHLTVQEGEFVTLLGPSGCGKSTLLKMIAGLLEPTDGRLLLWRKPVAALESSQRKLAFVFQSPTLMPWADVASNVRLPLDLAGVPRSEADGRVAEALALLRDHPSLGAARAEVRRWADEARLVLAPLDDTAPRRALESLCDLVVERTV